MDLRGLAATRRRMAGVSFEWAQVPPIDAVSASWGVLESLVEMLRTFKADPAVIGIITSAQEQLKKTAGEVPATAWVS
jgi:hypothetical protein